MLATTPKWKSGKLSGIAAFFALRWDELVSPRTLDSWQLRTMNVPTLLREVIAVVDASADYEPYRGNLPYVIAEARHAATRDVVIAELYPHVAKTLELAEKTKDLPKVRSLAAALVESLGGYEAKAQELTLETLRSGKDEKERISNLASNLATNASIRGFSRAYLAEQTKLLLQPKPFLDCVGELFGVLARTEQTFTCILRTNWPRALSQAARPGFEILPASDVKPRSNEGQKFLSGAAPTDTILVLSVAALDPYAAARIAQREASAVLSTAHFFNPSNAISSPQRRTLVELDTWGRVLQPDDSHEKYMQRSSRLSERLKGLYATTVSDKLPETDVRALQSALQFHSLGVEATSLIGRLVNLWVALEALSSKGDGSIIERIATRVCPTIALAYLFRHLRQLAIWTYELKRSLSKGSALETIFGAEKVDREQLANFLVRDDADPALQALYAAAADDPLLVYRLYKMHQLLRHGDEAARATRQNRQNIDWQLRRIYRARNSVMHRGDLPERSEHLLQHLHTYLVLFLNSLLRELEAHPTLSINDCLARREVMFELFVGSMGAKTPPRLEPILKPSVLFT